MAITKFPAIQKIVPLVVEFSLGPDNKNKIMTSRIFRITLRGTKQRESLFIDTFLERERFHFFKD